MLILEGHQSAVTALTFSPDSILLASGGRDGAVWVWPPSGNGSESITCRSLVNNEAQSVALAFTADGELLVGRANYLRIEGEWVPFDQSGQLLAISTLSETLIAIGTGERGKDSPGELFLWDLSKHARRTPTFTEQHGVRSVATHPATKTVAWSNGSRRVTVWTITKPDPIRFNLKHTSPAIAFHPDGHRLVIAQQWGAVVWDVNRKQEQFSLTGHKGVVSSVAYSPDGSLIISGSWDGTVKLWDAETGTERQSFQWPTGKVFAVSCSPDGGRIAAAGQNGHVVIWDAE